jgi:SAM-dependent methyltransferase
VCQAAGSSAALTQGYQAGRVKQSYVKILQCPAQSAARKTARATKGTLLAPVYWATAHCYGLPGLYFQRYCSTLGSKMSLDPWTDLPFNVRYHLIRGTLESTRYFECDFAWRHLIQLKKVRNYLDVSSPSIFPLIVMAKRRAEKTYLLNPDPVDLSKSKRLIEAAKLEAVCETVPCLLEDASFSEDYFDVVTSLSVMEHIADDSAAIAKMWSLIRPGGHLILSMPCASEAAEEYHDIDPYSLQSGRDGWFFFQRYYDSALLQERILDIVGNPYESLIYGEKERGSFQRSLQSKLSDPRYPYWREPLMMAQEWKKFSSIEELPGEGVIAMAFQKPAESVSSLLQLA